MKTVRNILRNILIAVFALFIATPGFADTGSIGDVGDYGMWATENNRAAVNANIVKELNDFGPTQTVVPSDFVPIDAKIGLAFMGGMAKIGVALDKSLGRFAIIFMIIAYAFWVSFEAYNLIGTGGDAKKVVKDIFMKGILIAVWLIVLKVGIVKVFMMVMMPIVELGNQLTNMIWNSVVHVSGFNVTDTCPAIKNYAIQSTQSMPAELRETVLPAAGLLCVPSQMSSFFMTTMGIGWKMLTGAVGFSLFAFGFGGLVTYLSLKSLWKYLFVSLGVVADLFMALVLLPFTAIAETTAKTKYKGVAGDIFNSFLDIFKAEKLSVQIDRIIKAAIYFVFLAIAVGVSLSLLTFIIDPKTGQILSYQNMTDISSAIILVLTLLLVCYMADKAEKYAADWGGKIDDSLGSQVKKDVIKLWGISKENWKKFRDVTKKSRS